MKIDEFISGKNIDVNLKCPICGKEYSISVNEKAYNDFKSSGLIDGFLSILPESEIISLASGICSSCYESADSRHSNNFWTDIGPYFYDEHTLLSFTEESNFYKSLKQVVDLDELKKLHFGGSYPIYAPIDTFTYSGDIYKVGKTKYLLYLTGCYLS